MTKRGEIQRKPKGNPDRGQETVTKRGEIQRKPIGNPDRGRGTVTNFEICMGNPSTGSGHRSFLKDWEGPLKRALIGEKMQRKVIADANRGQGTVTKRGEIQRKPICNPDKGARQR